MTVASSTSRVQYNCSGGTTYDFTFGIGETSELTVIRTDALGVDTTLVETTNYSVSASNDDYSSGGTVTTVATYMNGKITILRSVPITQDSDYVEGMVALYETFEDGLDKLTRICQQQQEELDRTPKYAKSSAVSDSTMPEPSAGKVIGWSADGSLTNLAILDEEVPVSDFGAVLIMKDSISDVLDLLDGAADGDIIYRDGGEWKVLNVAEQRIVGRKTGGNIDDLTGAEVQAILAKYTSGLINLSIAATVGSKALTVALKGEDGNDPSATNPVTIVFRDETLTTGTPNIRTVTAATSVVLSSGSTLGFTAAAAGRLYVWAIDNAGTVELALSRTADIFPESNLVSTTAEGGAGAADSAIVMYSTTARTNVACRCIGYIEITTGATAGAWDNAPTKIQLMGPGVRRTGDVVQTVTQNVSAAITCATATPLDNTKPQITEGDQVISQAFAQTSAINRVIAEFSAFGCGSSGQRATAALFMNSVADAVQAVAASSTGTTDNVSLHLRWVSPPGTALITTIQVRCGANSGAFNFNQTDGGAVFNGVAGSGLTITEVFA